MNIDDQERTDQIYKFPKMNCVDIFLLVVMFASQNKCTTETDGDKDEFVFFLFTGK